MFLGSSDPDQYKWRLQKLEEEKKPKKISQPAAGQSAGLSQSPTDGGAASAAPQPIPRSASYTASKVNRTSSSASSSSSSSASSSSSSSSCPPLPPPSPSSLLCPQPPSTTSSSSSFSAFPSPPSCPPPSHSYSASSVSLNQNSGESPYL